MPARGASVFRFLGLGIRGGHDDALKNSLRNSDRMLAVLHLAGVILFVAMRPTQLFCRPGAVPMANAPVAVPKGKGQCPSTMVQSGNYCVEKSSRR